MNVGPDHLIVMLRQMTGDTQADGEAAPLKPATDLDPARMIGEMTGGVSNMIATMIVHGRIKIAEMTGSVGVPRAEGLVTMRVLKAAAATHTAAEKMNTAHIVADRTEIDRLGLKNISDATEMIDIFVRTRQSEVQGALAACRESPIGARKT